MRFVVITLCLVLTACVTPQPQKTSPPKPLPANMRGVWEYPQPYDIVFDIRDDGKFFVKTKSDGSILETHDYKLIHQENSRSAYIITREYYDNQNGKGYSYSYAHIFIEIFHDAKNPPRIEWHHTCVADASEWNLPDAEYQRRIFRPTAKECDIRKTFSAEHFYRRG